MMKKMMSMKNMRKCHLYFIKDLRIADSKSFIVAEIDETGKYTLTKTFQELDLFTKEIIEVFCEQVSKADNPLDFAIKSTGQPHTSIYVKILDEIV